MQKRIHCSKIQVMPLFCTFDVPPKIGFSLAFQTLVICPQCTEDAISGGNPWRWRTDDCFRCGAKAVRVYGCAPDKIDVPICERCLKAGHAFLTGAEPLPDPKPRRQMTKAELTSGNI